MFDQSGIEVLQGQLCSVKGNQPIELDDPKTVWVVQSGELALFTITVRPGIPEGARQYLFSISVGDALFGMSPAIAGKHRSILAVPLVETQLLKVKTESLEQLIADEHPEANALLEGWIHHLASVSTGNTVEARLAASLSLHRNTTYTLLNGGNPPKFRAEGTSARTSLNTQVSSLVVNVDTLPKRLAILHTNFFRYLERLEQQEQLKQRLRFKAREHFNRRARAEALGELASLVQEGRNVTFDVSTSALVLSGKSEFLPLMVAIGAIGRALGVTIRHKASLDLSGDSLEAMSNDKMLRIYARASRLRMRQVLLTDCWWKKDCDPMLAYTRSDNRPVALLPACRENNRFTIELLDPESGTRTPVDARVAAQLAADAYTFYRPLPEPIQTSKATAIGGSTAKEHSSLQPWDLLHFALQGRAKDLKIILWSGIAATLLGMFTPHATAILIDHAIPAADRELLMQIGFGLLAAAFGATSFQLAQGFAILRLESFADASTQAAVWDRLLSLEVPFFRQYSTGDLESRVSAISEIRRQLSGTALRSLFSSIFSLLNLALLFYYSWSLALVACIFASVAVAGTTISGVLTLRYLRPLQELQGKVFGVVVQLINGMTKLRVAGAQERAFAYWAKTYSQQVRLMLRTQRIRDYLTVFNAVLPTVSSGCLFWIASLAIQAAQVSTSQATELLTSQPAKLSTGTFLAFNAAFGVFIAGATSLSESVISALEIVTLWERAKPILEAQPEVDASKAEPGRLSGQLALDRVSFRYQNDGPFVLEDVSLYAEPGEMIALVGPSGSGKSTVLRLLLGFEIPQSGQVYYDDQELRGLDLYAVRRQLGVVMQNSRLNKGSIFENIASGAALAHGGGLSPIAIDEAWEAARQASLADEIAAMPMGMHTIVSEGGSNFSGGQRQRLLIARALVSQPQILLLDEATSFLDNKTQAIVSESLDKLKVTRVVIAHRLSTIRNADRIYVFEAGRIVQQGSFEQLANQEGLFARLIQRQMV